MWLVALASLAGCAGASVPVTNAAPPRARPLVYVALGASDAVGVGAAGPSESWVADFYRKLPAGSRVVDLGISGERLHQALTDELPVAVDAKPDLVTIWLAVNDINDRVSPDSYAQDLNTLLTTLQEYTHARVLIGNVPDLSLLPVYAGIDPKALTAAVSQWNSIIARQAVQHGATVVDLYGSWKDLAAHPEYVGIDGFHPSPEGYQRLADLFYAVAQAQVLGRSG